MRATGKKNTQNERGMKGHAGEKKWPDEKNGICPEKFSSGQLQEKKRKGGGEYASSLIGGSHESTRRERPELTLKREGKLEGEKQGSRLTAQRLKAPW